MKTPVKLLLSTVWALLILSSCATLSYTPKVSLDVSPKTIPKSLQVEKFTDKSPAEDTKNPFMGSSITNLESLSSNLDLEVTNAIISDFNTNAVFKQAGRRIEEPDYILKGTIKRFYGKTGINNYGKVSFVMALATLIVLPAVDDPVAAVGFIPLMLWYTGIPISNNSSNIEIELALYNKNGELVNTYAAKAYIKTSTNLYKNKSLALPTLTNRVFSDVVMRLRTQILNDPKLSQ
jgi:hypothetical protein